MLAFSQALAAAMGVDDTRGLMSLEYGDDGNDPYGAIADKTEVARPPSSHDFEGAPQFEDATVKMNRDRYAHLRGETKHDGADETAVMIPRNDESTAKRAIPEEIARRERAAARPCAMCQTMNPPHARACGACGISLAQQDQEAVRARVTAPRTAQTNAPQMPPPVSGAYSASGIQQPYAPSPLSGVSGVQNVQAAQWAQAAHQAQQQRPPTAWQRFLKWAGIRQG
jgi:hypothetical protein